MSCLQGPGSELDFSLSISQVIFHQRHWGNDNMCAFTEGRSHASPLRREEEVEKGGAGGVPIIGYHSNKGLSTGAEREEG